MDVQQRNRDREDGEPDDEGDGGDAARLVGGEAELDQTGQGRRVLRKRGRGD